MNGIAPGATKKGGTGEEYLAVGGTFVLFHEGGQKGKTTKWGVLTRWNFLD